MNELFPSAIMFGMSSKEFWEEDTQLYWAYRTFYLQKTKTDTELMNYEAWLFGNYTCMAVSVALNNAFSKKKTEYPDKPFGMEKEKAKNKLQKELEQIKDKNVRQQTEFNFWARL